MKNKTNSHYDKVNGINKDLNFVIHRLINLKMLKKKIIKLARSNKKNKALSKTVKKVILFHQLKSKLEIMNKKKM